MHKIVNTPMYAQYAKTACNPVYFQLNLWHFLEHDGSKRAQKGCDREELKDAKLEAASTSLRILTLTHGCSRTCKAENRRSTST